MLEGEGLALEELPGSFLGLTAHPDRLRLRSECLHFFGEYFSVRFCPGLFPWMCFAHVRPFAALRCAAVRAQVQPPPQVVYHNAAEFAGDGRLSGN